MSWQSWLRNFWRYWDQAPEPIPRQVDPESTQDFPGAPSLPYSGSPSLRVGVVSIVGNVREHNEDNFYVPGIDSLNNGPTVSPGSPGKHDTFSSATTADFGVPSTPSGNGDGRSTEVAPPAEGLYIVADGMGGQLAGEKASQMAVELIPAEVARRLPRENEEKGIQRALRDSVAKANEEILALSHLGTEFANMGTTVVLIQFKDDRAYVTGIGDSRAYRLRDGKLEQLTKDHSLANALGEAGTIKPEEVETHKFKHVLYLYLGSRDARDGPEDIKVVDVKPGDQFLLASDGLMGVVRDETIREILLEHPVPQEAAQALVDRALDLKSKDNITALVIHVA